MWIKYKDEERNVAYLNLGTVGRLHVKYSLPHELYGIYADIPGLSLSPSIPIASGINYQTAQAGMEKLTEAFVRGVSYIDFAAWVNPYLDKR